MMFILMTEVSENVNVITEGGGGYHLSVRMYDVRGRKAKKAQNLYE